MSVTPAMFIEHVEAKMERAEAQLDDILLSPLALDQFSRDGGIDIPASQLRLTPREINTLLLRYQEEWVVAYEHGRLYFRPRKEKAKTNEDLAESRTRRRYVRTLEFLRELLTICSDNHTSSKIEDFLREAAHP